jgi:hypothetical protein
MEEVKSNSLIALDELRSEEETKLASELERWERRWWVGRSSCGNATSSFISDTLLYLTILNDVDHSYIVSMSMAYTSPKNTMSLPS